MFVNSATSSAIMRSNCCGVEARGPRHNEMTATGNFWLVASLLVAVGLIGALFLYGWKHRKDRLPDVPPLPPEEDDWRK